MRLQIKTNKKKENLKESDHFENLDIDGGTIMGLHQ
jgi:hypothetical protein